MRRGALAVLLGAVAVAIAGCGDAKQLLGTGKHKPDEFAVYSRAPLSLPPDYGLRPPEPGSDRPSAVMPQDEAKQAVFGAAAVASRPGAFASRVPASPVSPGEQALLERSGAINADPGIRQIVNEETSILAEEDKSFTDRLIFWGKPTEYGTIVDPVEEAKRIHQNQALGRSLTAGETPIIERKKRALFEGIFN